MSEATERNPKPEMGQDPKPEIGRPKEGRNPRSEIRIGCECTGVELEAEFWRWGEAADTSALVLREEGSEGHRELQDLEEPDLWCDLEEMMRMKSENRVKAKIRTLNWDLGSRISAFFRISGFGFRVSFLGLRISRAHE